MSLLLPLLILLPLLAALSMLLGFGRHHAAGARLLAIGISSLTVVLAAVVLATVDGTQGTFQLGRIVPWVPSIGLGFGFGVDGLSAWLLFMVTLLGLVAVLAVEGEPDAGRRRGARAWYGWLLALQASLTGTVVATDALFFYTCFELSLIPTFFLVRSFGHGTVEERAKAARVFFFTNFSGSLLTLAAILYAGSIAAAATGRWSFELEHLRVVGSVASSTEQTLLLVGFLAGFALKAPIWPLHGWLPTVQAATPRSGALDVAALALKLGPYALLRFALPMCPVAISTHGNLLAFFAVVGVLYAALVGWVQRDAKRVLAHASVSHMGFALLGLFALDADRAGAAGAMLYITGYAAAAAGLFLCIGLIQERTGSRDLRRVGGLVSATPVLSAFLLFFVMASVGLPGLSGFVGEFMALLGAFQSVEGAGGIAWPFAALAALGVVLAAMYLLRLVAKLCFGELKLPEGVARPADLLPREVAMLAPLAFLCVFLGFFPQAFLAKSEAAIAAFVPATRVEAVVSAPAGDPATLAETVLISTPAHASPR